jgi:hypothetical protein
MAKLTVNRPPPTENTYTLEISEDELQLILALLGGLAGHGIDLYNLLAKNVIGRKYRVTSPISLREGG